MLITKYELEGTLLNIGRHSKGGDNLTRHPNREEIIERRTASQQTTYDNLSDEDRKLMYGRPGELNGMYGKTHTDKVKLANSELHMGNNYRLGHKATDETKAKMSAIASARVGELNTFYGKKHSEETRVRLSNANKGKMPINTNRLEIDGVVYNSQAEAARFLGVSGGTITHRINSKNPMYSGYKVI